MKLSEKIRMLREEEGFSPEELAKRIPNTAGRIRSSRKRWIQAYVFLWKTIPAMQKQTPLNGKRGERGSKKVHSQIEGEAHFQKRRRTACNKAGAV